jgi:hypothetical protein
MNASPLYSLAIVGPDGAPLFTWTSEGSLSASADPALQCIACNVLVAAGKALKQERELGTRRVAAARDIGFGDSPAGFALPPISAEALEAINLLCPLPENVHATNVVPMRKRARRPI